MPWGSHPLGGEGAMPFGLRLQDTKTTSVTQFPPKGTLASQRSNFRPTWTLHSMRHARR